MTNRSKSAKKARLRYLDLSFEGREQAKRGGIDNGRRPHGGYKGSKKHPPSPFSIEKTRDFHKKLREEIDELFEEDFLEIHGSPSWTLEASKEVTHSGESPLFLHKFMSPTKFDNHFIRFNKSSMPNPHKCQAPPTREGVMYYRPNRTHQYLSATDLRNNSQNEVNLKYGRPTRTTLLRARQRTNSAPVNSYELRRDMLKRFEEIKNGCIFSNPKEVMLQVSGSSDGESLHSFLTGARYNRAHCLDAKSLEMYGVYMPRNNPMACFVTGNSKLRDIFDTPSAPPDSPRSDIDEASSLLSPNRPTTAPGFGRRTSPAVSHPRQAWGDGSATGAVTQSENEDDHVIEEVIFWPTGLNVKGSKISMAFSRNNSMPRLESKLPSVHGVSVAKIKKTLEPLEETSSINNQPPPSPIVLSTKDGAEKLAEIVSETKSEPEETKKEEKNKKTKPILVDRAVNVPSVAGDSNFWKDDPCIIVSTYPVGQNKATAMTTEALATSEDTTKLKRNSEDVKSQDTNPEKPKTENQNEDEGEKERVDNEADLEVTSVSDGASMEAKVASSLLTSEQPPATPDCIIDVIIETKDVETAGQKAGVSEVGGGQEDVKFFLTEKGGENSKDAKQIVKETAASNQYIRDSGAIKVAQKPPIPEVITIPEVKVDVLADEDGGGNGDV